MRQSRPVGGFSLVEVLCAILILGIGMVALTQGLTTALKSSKESEQQTTAAMLAAGRIELVRADGYLTDGMETGVGANGISHYRWEQTISSTQIDGLHEVKVLVQHAKSGQVIYELQTLLFDPPSTLGTGASSSRGGKEARRKERKAR